MSAGLDDAVNREITWFDPAYVNDLFLGVGEGPLAEHPGLLPRKLR